jgi:hypothetical protein
MVTNEELRKALRDMWPNLDGTHGIILLKDKKGYHEPDMMVVDEIIMKVRASWNSGETDLGMLFGVPEKADCDDWALEAYARVRAHFRATESLPVCFGQVIGNKFDGEFCNHTKNILYSDGLYLLEPQTGKIKRPVKGEDAVWFVEI